MCYRNEHRSDENEKGEDLEEEEDDNVSYETAKLDDNNDEDNDGENDAIYSTDDDVNE